MNSLQSSRPLLMPLAALAALATGAPASADAEALSIYAAGSLRATVTELSRALATQYNIEVQPTFGGSGLLRERIEHGEPADLLLSADLGSPRTLAGARRTVVPAIAFARNSMCILSYRESGITRTNLIDRLLQPQLRIRTSTPVADPSGDYAWAIFDRIDALRPHSGAALKDKATRMMNLTPQGLPAGQNPAAVLFARRQIDVSITYCSAGASLVKDVPGLTSMPVPPELDPHPVYGAAVLTDRPAALRATLFLLSEPGQAIVAQTGLLPVLAGTGSEASGGANLP